MKKILILILITFLFELGYSQGEGRWPNIDKSVMDAITYPRQAQWRNYFTGEERTTAPKIQIYYSKPVKNERDIFGALVPYGQEWRLGANEATQIHFYQAVRIGKTTIPGGTYTLFATPRVDEWTFALSTEQGLWGGANRDPEATIATYTSPVRYVNNVQEELAMTFQKKTEEHVNLIVAWDNVQVALPITFDPISFASMDLSPMDIAHYPPKSAYTNYLEGDEKNIKPKLQLRYGRPYKKGRVIFGGLHTNGDIWRIGANESTELTAHQNIKVGDQEIRKGKYALYAVLGGDTWDIIFSKDLPSWGPHNRDEEKDVARVTIPVTQEDEELENLSIIFEEGENNTVYMVIGWGTTRATLPIQIVE